MKLFLFALITPLLLACNPYLKSKTLHHKYFKSSTRCAQGPFRFVVRTTGSRWGETATLKVHSKHDVAFRYNISRGTVQVMKGSTLGTSQANEHCMPRDGEGSPLKRTETSGRGAGSPGNEAPTAPPSPTRTGAVPLPPAQQAVLQEVPNRSKEVRDIGYTNSERKPIFTTRTVTLFNHAVSSLGVKSRFTKGEVFVITLWSMSPNDMKETYFEIQHTRYYPSDKKKWMAHLRKKERARLARLERARRSRLKVCFRHLVKDYKGWEVCRQFEDEKSMAACRPIYFSNTSCWSRKLKSVTWKRYTWPRPKAYRPKPKKQKKRAPLPKKVKPRVVSRFIVDAPPKKPPFRVQKSPAEPTPMTPPPAPRAEAKSPKPSQNATWIPGFYRWNGKKWFWFGGFWRVPKSDITQGKTQKAPTLPPKPKVEKRHTKTPHPKAVWAPGYWMWRVGAGYVWVPGRWVLSRGHHLRWVPPHWRRTPHGIVFVPGGWVPR